MRVTSRGAACRCASPCAQGVSRSNPGFLSEQPRQQWEQSGCNTGAWRPAGQTPLLRGWSRTLGLGPQALAPLGRFPQRTEAVAPSSLQFYLARPLPRLALSWNPGGWLTAPAGCAGAAPFPRPLHGGGSTPSLWPSGCPSLRPRATLACDSILRIWPVSGHVASLFLLLWAGRAGRVLTAGAPGKALRAHALRCLDECRGLPHRARSHLQIVDILREQRLGTTLQSNVLCWQQLEGNGVGEAHAFMENMQVTRACREQSRWRGRHRGGEPGAAGLMEQREGPGFRQRQKGEAQAGVSLEGLQAAMGVWPTEVLGGAQPPVTGHHQAASAAAQAPPPRKSSGGFSSSGEPPASPQEGRPWWRGRAQLFSPWGDP